MKNTTNTFFYKNNTLFLKKNGLSRKNRNYHVFSTKFYSKYNRISNKIHYIMMIYGTARTISPFEYFSLYKLYIYLFRSTLKANSISMRVASYNFGLTANVFPERQIFEKLFHGNFWFTLRTFAKNLLRRNRRINIFFHIPF